MNDWVQTGNLKGPQGIRGGTWYAGDDYPANLTFTGTLVTGDMYLKAIDPNAGSVWRWSGFNWLYTGADITGPPNSLTIGTVTTVLPTEPAAAEITGDPPNQVLSLDIPQGPPGPGAEGENVGTGTGEVFAGADPGTGVIQFARLRQTGIVTITTDANGVEIGAPVPDWAVITGKPATFPPTLPIAQSGVTNLTTDLAALDTRADALETTMPTKAPLASPALTGTPTAPTPATADNDTSVATTAYVKANLASYAPLASPAFTGNPTAPTPATADNDTSVATTAFVKASIAAAGAVATVGEVAPAAPLTGQLWWKDSTDTLSIWNGSAWKPVVGTWA